MTNPPATVMSTEFSRELRPDTANADERGDERGDEPREGAPSQEADSSLAADQAKGEEGKPSAGDAEGDKHGPSHPMIRSVRLAMTNPRASMSPVTRSHSRTSRTVSISRTVAVLAQATGALAAYCIGCSFERPQRPKAIAAGSPKY